MKTFSIGRQRGGFHPVIASSPDLFEVLADWLEATQGRMDFDTAFARLVSAVGADAGCIVRRPAATGRSFLISCHDRARSSTVRPLEASFAADCLGDAFRNAEAGRLWTFRNDPGAIRGSGYVEWSAARGFRDMIVLVLAGSGGVRDHVELHFAEDAGPDTLATLAAFLPSMARAWAARRIGLVSSLTSRRTAPPPLPPAQALSAANPFRLSRAEFRICVLLSRGHSVASLIEETGLCEATIRSHLRTVYAKTGCASLAELVFRLLDGQSPAATAGRRLA
jgi:DNA-binding CsgD family transcriptional regulator